jgi:N-acetylglucosaminyl-diphospho-decaprenol L-rhamnosyltransferase
VHDLAIITVSTREPHWIRAMLPTVFERLGDIDADVVVVDNNSDGLIADVVAEEFPEARVVSTDNHGFGHANNRGLMTCNARYVLFINPDTEVLDGTFEELVRLMDERPTVGLVGCRQIIAEDGSLCFTGRYFPNALRALGDALGAERLPGRRPRFLGERETDPSLYDREFECDWTSGSFMLARREALESAGYFDERFFLFSEETDLCRRIKTAGWEIRHLPQMTILHHATKDGVKPHIESLIVVTRMMYARKHFSPLHRPLYYASMMLGHFLRLIHAGAGERGRLKRAASRQVIETVFGRRDVPFAKLTSPRSVLTADPDLRHQQMLARGERERDGVAG